MSGYLKACLGPHDVQKVTGRVILPFQVAGFNPSNFHVTQQGFKPNPYHCKVPYVSQVIAFMQRPAKNIEIGYKKWKGLTGDDFFSFSRARHT
ncbi:hypothetical protein MO408_27360 (plasmid) [Klebsiella pneumoniae]|nr:hypothetical protein MO408_27360 [Klebsiella pneumoniae]